MADKTKIEWSDATWNPITGCTLVDEGCRNCYAAHLITSWPAIGNHPSRKGLARKNAAGEAKFTGEVRFNEQWLDQPLRWKKPRKIFVCAHGDLFHESVPDEWIDRVFAVMALAPQHTFQLLTKRPERACAYLQHMERCYHASPDSFDDQWAQHGPDIVGPGGADFINGRGVPLSNVWLGTSVSDQASADLRIPHLLATPAAVRFASAEPLLGPWDTKQTLDRAGIDPVWGLKEAGLHWVICGGESGPRARPMHPDHVRSLRDQCVAAGVSFFMKQWGWWAPEDGLGDAVKGRPFGCFNDAGRWVYPVDRQWANAGRQIMHRVGKARAGRLLDGRTWDQMPEVQHG